MSFEEARNSLFVMTDDMVKISSKNHIVSLKREMEGDTFSFFNEKNVCTTCNDNSQKKHCQSKGRGPIEKERPETTLQMWQLKTLGKRMSGK